ncbi:MAG TPA: GTPase HflX [Kofleriaceae bacterium]|nr:GTPase HflX [Kofleriaceae bacterium]
MLVGLYAAGDLEEPDLSLDELASLVDAAGGVVVGRSFQRRQPTKDGDVVAMSAATYIGKGKAQHVASLVQDLEANVVVFDNELTPAQIRELEKLMGCKVIDRSELILDIFAGRARTREARLQVELAQLEYTAPRLRGMWTHLERQAGTGGSSVGLGMKGPGEKQIEIDRRIVKSRITKLQTELETIHGRKQREVQSRIANAFTVGLVGYTNAGKSTLMNALTDAGTYQADQLFATLDTKTRQWKLGSGPAVALSDTVGFVRRLPHHLIASFRATLEEALNADLLLHVIDASHPQAFDQITAVERVLAELGCELGRVIPVLNKVDAIADPDALVGLRARMHGAISISARTGAGLDLLTADVARRRSATWVNVRVSSPASNGKVQAVARSRGCIIEERFDDDRWIASLELSRADLPALRGAGAGDLDIEIVSG